MFNSVTEIMLDIFKTLKVDWEEVEINPFKQHMYLFKISFLVKITLCMFNYSNLEFHINQVYFMLCFFYNVSVAILENHFSRKINFPGKLLKLRVEQEIVSPVSSKLQSRKVFFIKTFLKSFSPRFQFSTFIWSDIMYYYSDI